MIEPPSKKQKIEAAKTDPAPLPIIFKLPGHKVDIRFQVFQQVFHVHSVLLKIHSSYFLKFLDSLSNLNRPSVPEGNFPYEWVTKIESDGGWALGSVSDTVV